MAKQYFGGNDLWQIGAISAVSIILSGGITALSGNFTNLEATNATTTNQIVTTVARLPADTLINGISPCLESGTDCPTLSAAIPQLTQVVIAGDGKSTSTLTMALTGGFSAASGTIAENFNVTQDLTAASVIGTNDVQTPELAIGGDSWTEGSFVGAALNVQTAFTVNGETVCLNDGTNCPAAGSGSSNWTAFGTGTWGPYLTPSSTAYQSVSSTEWFASYATSGKAWITGSVSGDAALTVSSTAASTVSFNLALLNDVANGYTDIRAFDGTDGIRIYAASTTLASIGQSAAFQFFGNYNASFPGQAYIDSGSHNSAFISLRTAQTNASLTERLRIAADGTTNFRQGVTIDAGNFTITAGDHAMTDTSPTITITDSTAGDDDGSIQVDSDEMRLSMNSVTGLYVYDISNNGIPTIPTADIGVVLGFTTSSSMESNFGKFTNLFAGATTLTGLLTGTNASFSGSVTSTVSMDTARLGVSGTSAFTGLAAFGNITAGTATTTGVHAAVICFTTDTCRTTWPTSGGGSGTNFFTDDGTTIKMATSTRLFQLFADTTLEDLIVTSTARVGSYSSGKLFEVYGNQSGGIMRVTRDVGGAPAATIYGTQDIVASSSVSGVNGWGVAQTYSLAPTGTLFTVGQTAGVMQAAQSSANGFTGQLDFRAVDYDTTNGLQNSILQINTNPTFANFFFWPTKGLTTDFPFSVGSSTGVGADNLLTILGGGQLQVQDGSSSIPAYSFKNDTDTGIYRAGTNSLGFTAGTNVVTWSSSGLLPGTDATFSLGGASNRWLNGWFSGSVTSSNLEVTTTLKIPNGSNCTASTLGQICFDTTANQLLVASSTAGGDPMVFNGEQELWGYNSPASSTEYIANKITMNAKPFGFRMTKITCSVKGGTSVDVNIDTDAGGANTNTVTCGTAVATTSITSNNVIAANTNMALELGTKTGAVTNLIISIFGTWTRQ